MQVKVKHDLLRSLREGRAIPVEAMSKKLNIPQEEYLEFEKTDKEVDVSTADRIAGVFKRNWTVFLLSSAPPNIKVGQDNRTVNNHTPHLHEETINALEEADFALDFAENFEDQNQINLSSHKQIVQISPKELAKIERDKCLITIDEQKKFKSDSEAYKSWVKFVESKGIFVSQKPLSVEDGVRAFSKIKNNKAIIVINSHDKYAGKIFSLFHEFGHLLRRTSGLCDLNNSQSANVETYCNQFAAEFLVPDTAIKEILGDSSKNVVQSKPDYFASRISVLLKVSKLAAYGRMVSLGFIDSDVYSQKHKDLTSPSQVTQPIREGSSSGGDYHATRRARNGIAYSGAVFNALDRGKITVMEAGKALGVGMGVLKNYKDSVAHYVQQ